MSFAPVKGQGFQATAVVSILLQRIEGKDTVAVLHDTTRLSSTFISDTTQERKHMTFMDLRRLPVPPGSYLVSAMVWDANKARRIKRMAIRAFEIATPVPDHVTFSDVELLYSMKKTAAQNTYSKNGYDIVPLVTDANFNDRDTLGFYVELYHTDALKQPAGFFASADLRQGDRLLKQYSYSVGRKPNAFDVFSGRMDIKKLPEGQYSLDISLRSYQNELLGYTSIPLYVKNSRADEYVLMAPAGDKANFLNEFKESDLDYFIKTLRYLSTDRELGLVKVLTNYDQKKNFLYTFWEKRITQEQTVMQAVYVHRDNIDYANRNFKSTMRQGWETERGRVLIKYGKPNNVERYPAESSMVPYESWRYDHLQSQNNVIFVFADMDLATSDYILLHSNKYGESNNPTWRQELRRNTVLRPNVDYDDSRNQSGYDTKLNPR